MVGRGVVPVAPWLSLARGPGTVLLGVWSGHPAPQARVFHVSSQLLIGPDLQGPGPSVPRSCPWQAVGAELSPCGMP